MITIDYIVDQEKGNCLVTSDTQPGWIEFLQKTGKIYYCQGPKSKLHQTLQKTAKAGIVKQAVQGNVCRIGIIKSLANERLLQPFVLPPMLTTDSRGNIELGTGLNRLMAEIMCGTPSKDLSFVMYTSNLAFEKDFDSVTEITSTEHYNKLYNLNGIDYRITMAYNSTNEIKFTSSVVRHGLYDFDRNFDREKNTWFTAASNKLAWYFDQFKDRETNKILVNVQCTEDVAKFIPPSNDNFEFNIVHQPADEWKFSYGKLLGAYRPDKKVIKYVLNLWVYDITESLNLESLVLWCDPDYAAYYTKNRKIAMFETTHITSIKEIGDFVK